jgi:hypothetical protein
MRMQYDKTSETSLSNEFGQRGGPKVNIPIYRQDSGHLNAVPNQGSAGGEIPRADILDRLGKQRPQGILP